MSKILIIEDEVSLAELEKDYLELAGFEVAMETDGTGGLAAAIANDYDLIILDLMLPGIDGFEICKEIRSRKDTPIMMISAKKDDIDKIALAYTVSVRKAQGSEYNVVFLAISKAHTIMLNKNLIYTAVSRASNKLIILGDKETFIKGARKNMRIRKTSLKDSLLNYYQNNQ